MKRSILIPPDRLRVPGLRKKFFLLSICLFTACLIRAQTFTGTYKRAPLKEVIKELEADFGLVFAFETKRVEGKTVTITLKKEPLNSAVKKIMDNAGLRTEWVDEKSVVLHAKEKGDGVEGSGVRTLFGRIKDHETQEPLPYATVYMKRSRKGVVADENGGFHFPETPTTSDTLIVRYLGYRQQEIPVNPKGLHALEIALKPSSRRMEDILITSQGRLLPETGQEGEMSFNPQKIQAFSVLGEEDIFRALQFSPGISATEESADGLYLRGGTPDQNLVLLDGITVYNTGHFFGMFHAFNARALDRVRVYRSNYGAQYGGRVSGVIDITGKPERPDTLQFGASANLVSANIHAQIPLFKQKASLLIAGRRSFNDIVSSPTYESISGNVFQTGGIWSDENAAEELNGEYELDPTSFFYDLHTRLVVTPSDNDLIAATFYTGGDQTNYFFQQTDTTYSRESNDELILANLGSSLTWDHQWSPDLLSTAQLAYSTYGQRYNYDQEVVEEADSFAYETFQDNRVSAWDARLSTTWKPLTQHQFEGGLHFNFQSSLFEVSTDDNENVLPDSGVTEGAAYTAYLQHVYSPNPKISLRTGLRYTFFDGMEEHFWEPRIQIRATPWKNWRFQANWGIYNQFLNSVIMANRLKLGENFFAVAAPEQGIDNIVSFNLSAGAIFSKGPFLVEVEGYRKDLEGLITYDRSFDTEINANQIGDQLSEGTGTIMGVDVLVRYVKDWYTGWAAYTLSNVTHEFPELNEGNPFPADHNHTHELKLVNMLKFGRWNLSATWILASGKPFTPVMGIDTLIDLEGEPYHELDLEPRNSGSLPAYHRLDLNVRYNFPLGKWGRARTGISLFNVYDHENIRDWNYTIEYDENDEVQAVLIERQLLGFSPNLYFGLVF